MSPRALLRALAAAATVMVAAAADAHDFWIEPSSFAPAPGSAIAVRLKVGEHFDGEIVPRPGWGFLRFDATLGGARRPIVGRPGAAVAGALRIAQPGLHILSYYSEPIELELPADRFEEHLRLEGLETIIAERQRRGESDRPGREVYTRCAKSLVLAGPADAAAGDKAIGLPLELVALRSPYLLAAGDALPVQLLHEGRPLAGALVVAIERQRGRERIAARSDADGRVRLALPHPGHWLVKAVHMVPAAAATGADWHSLWASLTFQIDGPPPPPPARTAP